MARIRANINSRIRRRSFDLVRVCDVVMTL